MDKSIYKIVKSSLCMGCGTCTSICPTNCIKLVLIAQEGKYTPIIDEKECSNCGLCFQVCPGQTQDISLERKNINISEEDLIGKHLNCYSGHSTDNNIRYYSASGGIITSILIHALESGLITGALVTRMKKNNPLEPEPFIARNKVELIEASGSKYCPVPVNVSLKEILTSSKNERFAFVGLPCHLEGVRKAQRVNKDLQNKIVFHIGIFCGGTPSFNATKFLLKRLNQNTKDIKSLRYRGNGWPGNLTVELKSGKNYIVPYPEYWEIFGNLFYSFRCKICVDWFAKMADISVGDAWLPEYKNERVGESLIISRSSVGADILQQMESKQKVNLLNLSINQVCNSQRGFVTRRNYLKPNLAIVRITKKKYIYINEAYIEKPRMHTYILFTYSYMMSIIASKNKLWCFLDAYCSFFKQISYLRYRVKESKCQFKSLVTNLDKKSRK